MKINNTRFVFIVLFAAIICAGCFIAVPIGPGGIPIVMQNMFAVLAALTLGGFGGFFSALLFVAAGALGLPVFSGGAGGIAHLLGPTGGFLAGYILAALVSGCIAGKPRAGEKAFGIKNIVKLSLASLAGFTLIYVPGILRFMQLTHRSFSASIAACLIPFIPGDLIKLVLSVPLAAKLRTIAARYFTDKSE